MGKKKALDTCKSTDDFVDLSYQRGYGPVRQTGSHIIVSGPHGSVPVPNKRDQLQKGTRASIVRIMRSIGYTIIAVGILLKVLGVL